MEGERGLLWVTGNVTIVSNRKSIHSLVAALSSFGLTPVIARFDEPWNDDHTGALVVDARSGAVAAVAFLRGLHTDLHRDAVLLAAPADTLAFATIRRVCQGVILYERIDPLELSTVIEKVLSRRVAS